MTRNVIFHENIFPYSFSLPSNNSIASIYYSHSCDISMYDFSALHVSHATNLTMNPATSLVSNNVEVNDHDLRTSHRVKNRSRYLDQYYYGVASTTCSTFPHLIQSIYLFLMIIVLLTILPFVIIFLPKLNYSPSKKLLNMTIGNRLWMLSYMLFIETRLGL